ncbi:hypothetical protein M1437_00840, partial [Patescibacteria group bacterium]|nr:hypothetical protein [Patescibacteria group bacterium]
LPSSLGKRYPRVFRAASIEDMQAGRAEEAKGLRERVHNIPTTNFGRQPHKLAAENVTAIIYLPEMQHYPAMDPQEDIKKLYGLTLHDNVGMRLIDKTGRINVWCDENSSLDFPFPTCFDEIDPFGNSVFNKEKWMMWREISWKKQVILLAQFSELSGSILKQMVEDIITGPGQNKPVTEYYWLLHISDPEGVVKKRGREKIAAPIAVPMQVPVLR